MLRERSNTSTLAEKRHGKIEREVLAEVGADGFETLRRLVPALGGDEQPRMLDYLRRSADLDMLRRPEE